MFYHFYIFSHFETLDFQNLSVLPASRAQDILSTELFLVRRFCRVVTVTSSTIRTDSSSVVSSAIWPSDASFGGRPLKRYLPSLRLESGALIAEQMCSNEVLVPVERQRGRQRKRSCSTQTNEIENWFGETLDRQKFH